MADGRAQQVEAHVGGRQVPDRRAGGLEHAQGASRFGDELPAMHDSDEPIRRADRRWPWIVPGGFAGIGRPMRVAMGGHVTHTVGAPRLDQSQDQEDPSHHAC